MDKEKSAKNLKNLEWMRKREEQLAPVCTEDVAKGVEHMRQGNINLGDCGLSIMVKTDETLVCK